MSKVYFKKLEDFNQKEIIHQSCYDMMNEIRNDGFKFETKIPMKVHFGEKGNNTFITPDNFDGIKQFLKENQIDSCYMDTNVLYKGSRTITKDHIATALEHGFNDYEIIIADGNEDEPYFEIEINQKYFDKCKIGTKFKDYNQYLIMSHFKGHGLAGMGAAIKQLAMGFASRGGKLHQHSESVPLINENTCISCGNCVRKCPVDAITLPDIAVINPDICIGCASCTTVCPVTAITNSWQTSNFHEKLAEYAYAAQKNKENIYFVFAFNITEECDCHNKKMDPIAPNIGIFASTDPVAIDTAVLSIYEEMNNSNTFENAWKTINYAEQIGLGSKKYELIIK